MQKWYRKAVVACGLMVVREREREASLCGVPERERGREQAREMRDAAPSLTLKDTQSRNTHDAHLTNAHTHTNNTPLEEEERHKEREAQREREQAKEQFFLRRPQTGAAL
jgi:hypothetical protein